MTLDDATLARFEEARSRFGAESMDEFIGKALGLAERVAPLGQPDGRVYVASGSPTDESAPIAPIRLHADRLRARRADEPLPQAALG